jgi:hypothetical protein
LRALIEVKATLGGEAGGTSTAAARATAQCVAEAAASDADALATPLVDELLSELNASTIGDARRVANLLALGEIGRRVVLGKPAPVAKVLLANFDGVEDVKQVCFRFYVLCGRRAVNDCDHYDIGCRCCSWKCSAWQYR